MCSGKSLVVGLQGRRRQQLPCVGCRRNIIELHHALCRSKTLLQACPPSRPLIPAHDRWTKATTFAQRGLVQCQAGVNRFASCTIQRLQHSVYDSSSKSPHASSHGDGGVMQKDSSPPSPARTATMRSFRLLRYNESVLVWASYTFIMCPAPLGVFSFFLKSPDIVSRLSSYSAVTSTFSASSRKEDSATES